MRVNSTTAKRTILIATIAVTATTTIRSVRDRHAPPPRTFLGAGVVALMLGVAAEIAPTFAAASAGLWVVGSILSDGEITTESVSAALNKKGLKQ